MLFTQNEWYYIQSSKFPGTFWSPRMRSHVANGPRIMWSHLDILSITWEVKYCLMAKQSGLFVILPFKGDTASEIWGQLLVRAISDAFNLPYCVACSVVVDPDLINSYFLVKMRSRYLLFRSNDVIAVNRNQRESTRLKPRTIRIDKQRLV